MTQFNLTWKWILENSPHTSKPKRQTRRLKTSGQYLTTNPQGILEVVKYVGPDYETVMLAEHGSHELGGGGGYQESESDWRSVYKVGKSYAVQPGRGKPGIWFAIDDDTGKPYYAHQTVLLDFKTTVTDWERAHQELFSHNGKANPEAWLNNNGYKPLRILLTNIRQEDARNISDADAIEEGFKSKWHFLQTWCGMYDKAVNILDVMPGIWLGGLNADHKQGYMRKGWGENDTMLPGLMSRPAKNYECWSLDFQPAKD